MNHYELEQNARNIVNAQDKLRKFLWNRWAPLPSKWMQCTFCETHNLSDDDIWYALVIELRAESLIFFENACLVAAPYKKTYEVPALELPYSEIVDITDVNPINSHASLYEFLAGEYGLHFFIKNKNSVKNSKPWKHIDIAQKAIKNARFAYEATKNPSYNEEIQNLIEFEQRLED